jgi:transcription factor IIIB 90 kDa subunit
VVLTPPAFQRAERQRLEAEKKSDEAASIKEAESISATQNSDVENTFKLPIKVIILKLICSRIRN